MHTLYLPVSSKEKRHIAVRQSWTCILSRLLTCILLRAYRCIVSTGHNWMNPIDRSKNNAYGGEAIGVRLHSIKFLESCGKNVTRNRKLELECLGSVFVEWVDNSLNRGWLRKDIVGKDNLLHARLHNIIPFHNIIWSLPNPLSAWGFQSLFAKICLVFYTLDSVPHDEMFDGGQKLIRAVWSCYQ